MGHGNDEGIDEPKRVEYFYENKLRAVAIGCGGYIYWDGGFTIVLVEDNRLFYCGRLGNDKNQLVPTQVIIPDRLILSISAGEDWAGIVTCRNLTGEDIKEEEEVPEEENEQDRDYVELGQLISNAMRGEILFDDVSVPDEADAEGEEGEVSPIPDQEAEPTEQIQPTPTPLPQEPSPTPNQTNPTQPQNE
uniref:Uncharacterized protein n=1 Tax=Arcella intermedia TaxID=1963864 RepID=A0A6B2LHM0_9EUKA